MVLGEWIEAVMSTLGPAGLLAAMFLIFLADAAIFPALPELFIVAFHFELTLRWAWEPLPAALTLLVLGVLGDLSGNAALYGLVRALQDRGRVPRYIQRAMRRWTSFLVVRDERILLVNRIAPAVPLTGAFIAVCGWNLRRSLVYVVVGGAAKYALLLALAVLLGITFAPDTARLVTITAVLVLIAASLAAGQVRKRRMGAGA